MDTVRYADAVGNLASLMDKACSDREPVLIVRPGEGSVVVLSLDDYRSLEETADLLRSPTNAKRLSEAVQGLEGGQGTVREIAFDA